MRRWFEVFVVLAMAVSLTALAAGASGLQEQTAAAAVSLDDSPGRAGSHGEIDGTSGDPYPMTSGQSCTISCGNFHLTTCSVTCDPPETAHCYCSDSCWGGFGSCPRCECR